MLHCLFGAVAKGGLGMLQASLGPTPPRGFCLVRCSPRTSVPHATASLPPPARSARSWLGESSVLIQNVLAHASNGLPSEGHCNRGSLHQGTSAHSVILSGDDSVVECNVTAVLWCVCSIWFAYLSNSAKFYVAAFFNLVSPNSAFLRCHCMLLYQSINAHAIVIMCVGMGPVFI